MNYEAKNFEHLFGLAGFSDELLKNHFTLYGGYVTNTNKVYEALKTTEAQTPQWNELKRRFGWEWNGMRLHELYFENMKKSGQSMSEGELKKSLTHLFGSFENWEKAFKAVGTMRGIGWVVLAYDPEGKKLFNLWINEHDVGHLAGTIPLLIMDVFEHAYMVDYGLKKVDYIETFFRNIDWPLVEKRLNL